MAGIRLNSLRVPFYWAIVSQISCFKTKLTTGRIAKKVIKSNDRYVFFSILAYLFPVSRKYL